MHWDMTRESTDQNRILLEVIACSLADAQAAERGGAHRIELISRFDVGGLTPALELARSVVAGVSVPVRVMLRESESFEVRDPSEAERLCATARALATMGIDGIVCGFVRNGEVDSELLARLLDSAPNLNVTFHRAFEQLRDPLAAIEQLKQYRQVDRILTSGAGRSLAESIGQLSAYQRAARPEITILAGGGMDAASIKGITEATPIREFHVGRAARQGGSIDGEVSSERVRTLLDAYS